jgi:hypothetical protein
MLPKPDARGKDYRWCIINIVTKWTIPDGMVVISFDTPDAVQDHLLAGKLNDLPASWLSDPYWPHLFFFDQFLGLQDGAVWAIRDRVRETEEVSRLPNLCRKA